MSLDNAGSARREDAEDFGFEYEQKHPRHRFPKRPGPDKIALCEAEWAWGPAHDRCERYFVTTDNRSRRLRLWIRFTEDRRTHWAPYCSVRLQPSACIIKAGYQALAQAWWREAQGWDGRDPLEAPHFFRDLVDAPEHLDHVLTLVWGKIEHKQ